MSASSDLSREPWHGRPEAAAVIWTAQGPANTAATPHAAGNARRRGLVRAAVAAAVGAAIFVFWSRHVGAVALGLALLVALAAIVSPTGLSVAIERAIAATARIVGRAVSWILLVPLFYLFFLPFGALFRRGRRDRMQRGFDPSRASYWIDRSERPASSPEHQY